MNFSKTISALVLSGGFVTSSLTPVLAAPACLRPGDAAAFNLIGLKSMLMVEALSCGMDKNYDQFMVKFQPQVQKAQTQMDGYFARQGGGFGGQTLEDQFTTQLANSESDAAAAQGMGFCNNATKQFAQISSLPNLTSLADYAVGLNLAAPPEPGDICPAKPTPPLVVASTKPKPPVHKTTPAPQLAVAKPPTTTPPAPPYMLAQTI